MHVAALGVRLLFGHLQCSLSGSCSRSGVSHTIGGDAHERCALRRKIIPQNEAMADASLRSLARPENGR